MISMGTTSTMLSYFNQRRLNQLNANMRFERLSTALCINRGVDDPSGLAIARGMESWVRGTQQAIHNMEDGLSLLRVQEAGLREEYDLLLRMRDLALRGANEATLTDRDREIISAEMSKLSEEVSRLAETTIFQDQKPLLGTPMNTNADLEIELEWGTTTDLDLHVFEPGALPIGGATGPGEHIYYNNTNIGLQGGQLDVDDNNGITDGYWQGLDQFTRIPINVATNPAQEHYIADPGDAYEGTYTICIDRWVGFAPTSQNVDTTYTLRVYRWRGTPQEDLTVFTGNIARDNTPPPTGTGWYFDPFSGWRWETYYNTVDSSDWCDAGSGFENVPGQDDPLTDYEAMHTIDWTPIDVPAPALLQCGAASDSPYTKTVEYFNCLADKLGVSGLSASTTAEAQSAVDAVDTAIGKVSDYLNTSAVNAMALEHIIDELTTESIHTEAARSHIEDADMAVEYVEMTKAQLMDTLMRMTADQIHDRAQISLFLVENALNGEAAQQNKQPA